MNVCNEYLIYYTYFVDFTSEYHEIHVHVQYRDIEYIVCGVKQSNSVFRLSNIRKHHVSPGVQVQNRPSCSPLI